MTRHLARAAVAFVVWWAVLLAIYLVLISSVTAAEVVVGAVVAAGAALVAVVASHAFAPASTVPRLRWRHTVWLPYDMLAETAMIAAFVVRYIVRGGSVGGSFAEVTMTAERPAHRPSHGPAPDQADALRAYGVLLLSLTPAGYVADDRAEQEPTSGGGVVVRVHRIGRTGRFARLVEQ